MPMQNYHIIILEIVDCPFDSDYIFSSLIDISGGNFRLSIWVFDTLAKIIYYSPGMICNTCLSPFLL